jgi:hypothetical protein
LCAFGRVACVWTCCLHLGGSFKLTGPAWAVPSAVEGPRGALHPHPMQRSRVLEVVRPVSVTRVTGDNSSGPGRTRVTDLMLHYPFLFQPLLTAPDTTPTAVDCS